MHWKFKTKDPNVRFAWKPVKDPLTKTWYWLETVRFHYASHMAFDMQGYAYRKIYLDVIKPEKKNG